MIYLTTGANGSFKTCNTIWNVRQQQLAENRPVFYHGFKAGPKLTEEFGWKWFDPRKWQDLPDGSICIMDEAQNEFPLRKSGADVPDYVNAVAQFRRARGFDFWICTPHPMLLDVFIRRLIDNPSWHRHHKRVAGSNMISQLQWNSVKVDCEKPGSGDSGEVAMVPGRKEVFGWYESASMHTGKRKIPRAVFVVVGCMLAVPLLGYYAYTKVMNPAPTLQAKVAAQSQPASSVTPAGAVTSTWSKGGASQLTAAEYVAQQAPRIPGLPHTAPVYDSVTQAVVAPYPAACLDGTRPATKQRVCECYTQQGTKLATPADLCRQIAAQGYFMAWHKEAAREAPPVKAPEPEPAPQMTVVPYSGPSPVALSHPSAVAPVAPPPAPAASGAKHARS